jgi:hypothetical protein
LYPFGHFGLAPEIFFFVVPFWHTIVIFVLDAAGDTEGCAVDVATCAEALGEGVDA